MEKFRIGATLRKIIANMGWLFCLRILRFVYAIFITAWVARYLGRDMFGVLNYGLAFAGLFGPLAILGLQGILVRDIVRDPGARDEILGTATVLRVASGTVSCFLVLVLIHFIHDQDPLVKIVTGAVSVTLIFQGFSSIEMYFQARVESKYSVIARSAALTLATLLKAGAILIAASVTTFAVIAALETVFIAAGFIVAYRMYGLSVRSWRFSRARAGDLLGQSWTLILSGALAMIYFKIDQVMLGRMAGESEVGIYSVAARLSEVWYFMPIAITTSVYPALIESRERGIGIYDTRVQQLFDFLAGLALSVAVIFTFAARPVILLLFGRQYEAGIPILSVHIWAGVFIFLRAALGRWLLNENELKFLLISNGLGAAINVGLNLKLIPLYGGMGAAVSTVISYGFASIISCFFYRPTWKPGWMMVKAIFFPVRFTAGLIRRSRR